MRTLLLIAVLSISTYEIAPQDLCDVNGRHLFLIPSEADSISGVFYDVELLNRYPEPMYFAIDSGTYYFTKNYAVFSKPTEPGLIVYASHNKNIKDSTRISSAGHTSNPLNLNIRTTDGITRNISLKYNDGYSPPPSITIPGAVKLFVVKIDSSDSPLNLRTIDDCPYKIFINNSNIINHKPQK